jgi:glycosyltransferase involved in cell wall biosynthesis
MKVLHVITFNAFGGAEKLITYFLPAMQQQGISTCCCILYHERYSDASAREAEKQLLQSGVGVRIIQYRSMMDKTAMGELEEYIREGAFDLIHSHLKYADFFTTTLKRKKKINVPVITTMHGYRDSYQNKYGLQVIRKVYFDPYYWVTRYVCRQFDGVIFISKCLKDFYRNAGLKVKNDRIIYHGYTSHLNHSTPVALQTERDRSAPQLALPGRLIKMKGHRFAIDAVKLLIPKYPGILLHFFGVGPEEEAIRQHVSETGMQDHVIFHGFTNNLDGELRKMDLVLIPSMGESFGMVFLEAFAAHVPVVAFDLPAGNEIIRNRYSGYLATPGSVPSLVENADALLADPDLKDRIAKQAYEELNQVFSLERMTRDYILFYKEITGKK